MVKHAIRYSDKEALPYTGCESNARDLQEPSHRRTLLPLSEEAICRVEFGLCPSEAPTYVQLAKRPQWRAYGTPEPHCPLLLAPMSMNGEMDPQRHLGSG